jgi:hypothetical protein
MQLGLSVLLLALASDGASPAGDGVASPARAEVVKTYDLGKMTRREINALDGRRIRLRVVQGEVRENPEVFPAIILRTNPEKIVLHPLPCYSLSGVFTVEGTLFAVWDSEAFPVLVGLRGVEWLEARR